MFFFFFFLRLNPRAVCLVLGKQLNLPATLASRVYEWVPVLFSLKWSIHVPLHARLPVNKNVWGALRWTSIPPGGRRM